MFLSKLIMLPLLLLALLPASANSLRIFSLGADEWARPRSGEIIPDFVTLRSAIDYWGKGTNAAILIQYPGEDSGEIWASELRDWFISLGVPSDYIMLVPGSQDADEITLVVGNRDELKQ
jgi:hypothetical protein